MPHSDDTKPILTVNALSVKLGSHRILDNISLTVQPGTIHALLGPNGAGKTTLIRCIVGGLPHKGTIQFRFQGSGQIGYVPQFLDFDRSLPLTVADFMAIMLQRKPVVFGTTKQTRKKIVNSLQAIQCHHLIDQLIGSLSGGELRRVLLAQALIPQPEVLILDEPASNIDELGARAFEGTLTHLSKEKNIAILIVGHDLATIHRIADRVTGIKETVTYNGPAAHLTDPAIVKAIYGVQVFDLNGHREVIG